MTLVSPILNRELLTFLRTKRAFGGLLLFLLVLSAAAGICWWATLSGGGWRDRDILSRNLFTTVTIAQLLIFSAYALILTCTTVNSERDTKTLDLLVSAPLSSLHIVLAKYTAALTVILLLVLASAPVLSLCFLLGGVGWQELVSAYCIILLAVLSYGMVGMACSTVCRKNYGALMAGFLLAAWLYCGVTLLSLVFLEWADLLAGSSSEDIILGVFETTSPLGAYMAANSMLGMPAPYLGASAVVLHAIFQLSVFVVSFLVAWLGFRIACHPAGLAVYHHIGSWLALPEGSGLFHQSRLVTCIPCNYHGDNINELVADVVRHSHATLRLRIRLVKYKYKF